MASVFKKDGGYTIQVCVNGKKRKIGGFPNKRQAERLGEKLELLKVWRATGSDTPELAAWRADLEVNAPEMWDRLVDFGLLPKRTVRKTIQDLINALDQDVKHLGTWTHLKNTLRHLIRRFGADRHADSITPEEAYAFVEWYRKAPLNTRCGEGKPYSPFKINRDIGIFKQLWNHGIRLGFVEKNPFANIRGGASGTAENKTYVPVSTVLEVIEAAPSLKWKTIIALGRFAGCRGACDLCLLTWDDVHWSSANDPGFIILRGKTRPGTIPLAPVLEALLRQLFDQAAPGTVRVFPEFREGMNTHTVTKQAFDRCGYANVKKPWYSLRASFCNDVLESGVDLKTYQAICRHSTRTAMESYQQYHDGRLESTRETLANCGLMRAQNREQSPAQKEGQTCGHTAGQKREKVCLSPQKKTLSRLFGEKCLQKKWARQDSNLGPPPYQGLGPTLALVCIFGCGFSSFESLFYDV